MVRTSAKPVAASNTDDDALGWFLYAKDGRMVGALGTEETTAAEDERNVRYIIGAMGLLERTHARLKLLLRDAEALTEETSHPRAVRMASELRQRIKEISAWKQSR